MPLARISPIATATTIFGIVFLAVLPPIGMVLLVIACLIQRRYRHGVLNARRAAYLRAVQKRKAERLATALRFSRGAS